MKKILPFVEGFFTAFACRVSIGPVLQKNWYGEIVDYYTASISELVGYYDFIFLILWLVCSVFFLYIAKNARHKTQTARPLAVVLSLLLPLGLLVVNGLPITMAVGSLVNAIKFSIQFIGFYFFFMNVLNMLWSHTKKQIK